MLISFCCSNQTPWDTVTCRTKEFISTYNFITLWKSVQEFLVAGTSHPNSRAEMKECMCLLACLIFFNAYMVQESLLMNGSDCNALGFKLISFNLIMTITHRCVHKSIQWKSPLSETLFPNDFCLCSLQNLTTTRTYNNDIPTGKKRNSNLFNESWRLHEWSKDMENFVFLLYFWWKK